MTQKLDDRLVILLPTGVKERVKELADEDDRSPSSWARRLIMREIKESAHGAAVAS